MLLFISVVCTASDGSNPDLPFTDEGIIINSGEEFDNLTSEYGREKIVQRLEDLGLGQKKVNQISNNHYIMQYRRNLLALTSILFRLGDL